MNREALAGVHLFEAGLISSEGVKIRAWYNFTSFELYDWQTFGTRTVNDAQIIYKVDFLIILVLVKLFVFDNFNLRNRTFTVLTQAGFIIFNIEVRSLTFGISSTNFLAVVRAHLYHWKCWLDTVSYVIILPIFVHLYYFSLVIYNMIFIRAHSLPDCPENHNFIKFI
jgi:hypothetical protein